ncbi:MAG: 30S ribosomal protein S16 [Planctomycetaceae bacterium]|nr:30S ribosomal protein S16 [Planctomycetaceae bacterium]
MVVLRMKRMGRIRRPFYRIGAMDKRSPRDGRVIEALGWFDPITTDPEKTLSLKAGRIHYWLSVGAQPSETVAALLKKNGIDPKPGPHHAALVDSDEPVSMESAAE